MKQPPESGQETPEIDKSENLAEIQNRAQALARTIGEDQTMQVKIGPRGGRTYWDWKENVVVIDEKDAERRTEEALGAISHEGMHKRISRASIIPPEILHDSGFNALMQTMEDVRVNTALEKMYPGAGDWIRETMKAIISEGEENNSIAALNQEVQKSLGYIPYQFEFCQEVQRHWTFGEYSEEVSPPVRQALDKIQTELDKVRTNIPANDADEKTKVRYAEDGYITLRTKIWPVYEELVALDKENETLRQFMLELASDSKNEAMDRLLGKIDEEELEELTNLLDGVKSQIGTNTVSTIAKSESDTSFNLVDFRKMSAALRTKMLETMKEKIQQPEENSESEENQEEETPQQEKKDKEGNKGESEKDKTQTEQEKKAEEVLKAIEDKIVEELRPKMMDPKDFETHAEFQAALEQAIEEANEIERIRQEEQERAEAMKGQYEKAYEQVAPLIEELAFELEEILYPNKASRWKPGYPTGSRVSLAKAMQFEADPRQYRSLFERKTLADVREYRFTLLVDLSGSMRMGNKNEEALKATVLFAEVLDRIGIKFEILGFNTLPREEGARDAYVFKDYSTPFDKDSKEKTERIIKDTFGPPAGYTDDGPAVLWASERLDKQDGQRKFVFVISDGEPAYSSLYGDEDSGPYSLESAIEKVMKKDQYLVGLGIGEGTESVKKYYPNNKVVPDVHKLAPEIGGVIKDIIENPEKYQL